jgi:Ca2+-transporting ATPase
MARAKPTNGPKRCDGAHLGSSDVGQDEAVIAAGLSASEAHRRLVTFGPNALVPETSSGGIRHVLVQVLTDPMSVLLVIAGTVYLALGDGVDALVTFVALLPIAAVTVVLELRGERALASLRRLAAPTALVIRDGKEQHVPALDVVPGDMLVVREGDVIAADARLVGGTELVVDESTLTGESLPVTKTSAAGDGDLYAGTTVLAGRATANVLTTGRATRYGAIGQLVASADQPQTPLQSLIRRLVVQLSIVAAVFCLAVVGLELWRGVDFASALIAGVSLAMAAIPEEFPMVFALYLGLGAWRLARDRALVRRLVGVETLGATSVICTDKTGTLTMGTIEVAAHWTPPHVAEGDLLRAAVLASEPRPYDPLDQAIVRFALSHGIRVDELHAGELVRDHTFDTADRYLSHVWRHDGVLSVHAKGALEGIVGRGVTAGDVRAAALAANERFAEQGMRVIAVASSTHVRERGARADDESQLALVGLVAFADPVRPGVADALAECRAAGVRVIVITGDHPVTAKAVAESLGLAHVRVATGADLDVADEPALATLVSTVDIFARTRPEQKHRIVRALRVQGHVVAMTGDGTNDAPALREADIGIAMGRRGTDVARSAATLVLLDDNFATIVAAVRDGRRIFENLRRSFSYLIAFHAPLLVSALVVPIVGAPLLLLPIHLVWLELVVHPTASLVFEADAAADDLMRRPPRARETGLLDRGALAGLLARGLALTVGVLGLYLYELGSGASAEAARGVAVAGLIFGQVLLVLLERAGARPLWTVGLSGNRALVWILGATLGSLVLVEYVGPLATLLHLAPPSPGAWLVALAVAIAATCWSQPLKAFRRGAAQPMPA